MDASFYEAIVNVTEVCGFEVGHQKKGFKDSLQAFFRLHFFGLEQPSALPKMQ